MATLLQRRIVMGKHERAKKNVNRLQLRREVIRLLSSDDLAGVQGGLGFVCLPVTCGCSRSGTVSTGG